MSTNNIITINKRTFVVMNVDAETGYGSVVGKGRTLGEAIEVAEKVMEKEEVEYGIHFVGGMKKTLL